MRVIAGSARGVRLARPPGGTRPLADRAREGLFSSLGASVAGARCLDLYAGTGAIGIEALSRGAGSCVFVDSAPGAVRTIRENLARARLEDRGRAVRGDARRYLERTKETYELAFVDPPYAEPAGNLGRSLEALTDRLDRNGAFVLTRPAKGPIDVIPVNWQVARRLAYGDALVLVCREGS